MPAEQESTQMKHFNAGIVRQVADEQGNEDAGNKRKTVSKRDFLDSAGNSVDKMEEADGARYTLLGDGGKPFDYKFGENAAQDKMFAIFGFHTKVGNVANTVLNDKNEPGTPADAADNVTEFLALTSEGKWAERAPGGVGAKIDKDALAEAICQVSEAAGKTVDKAAVRAKLEDNAVFVRTARQVPAIATKYAELTGKGTKTVDDLLQGL